MDEKYRLNLLDCLQHHLSELHDTYDQDHLSYHLERAEHFVNLIKIELVTPINKSVVYPIQIN